MGSIREEFSIRFTLSSVIKVSSLILLLVLATAQVGAQDPCNSSPTNCCGESKSGDTTCDGTFLCSGCGSQGCPTRCWSTPCNNSCSACPLVGGTARFYEPSWMPCGGIPGCCYGC